MANKWYPKALEAQLSRPANSSIVSGTVKLVLLTSAYTYDPAHEFLTSLTGVVGTAVTVTSKTYTDGAFGFSVPDYPGTGLAGQTASQAVVYLDTGTPATSRLLLHIDSAPNLPLQFLESNPGSPTGNAEDQAITVPPVPIAITGGVGVDNHFFPAFAEALLTRPAGSDLSTLSLMVVFVTSAYTYDPDHEFLSDVPSGQRTGTPQEVANLTFAGGIIDGDDVTFPPGITGGVAMLAYLQGEADLESERRLVAIKRQAQGLPAGGLTTTADQTVRWNKTGGPGGTPLGFARLGAQSA